jgi:hypothetical protein
MDERANTLQLGSYIPIAAVSLNWRSIPLDFFERVRSISRAENAAD